MDSVYSMGAVFFCDSCVLFYIVSIECSTTKNDVGLQITPCCSTIVQVCAPNVPPICEQTDLISAVSALLSDDTESLD